MQCISAKVSENLKIIYKSELTLKKPWTESRQLLSLSIQLSLKPVIPKNFDVIVFSTKS